MYLHGSVGIVRCIAEDMLPSGKFSGKGQPKAQAKGPHGRDTGTETAAAIQSGPTLAATTSSYSSRATATDRRCNFRIGEDHSRIASLSPRGVAGAWGTAGDWMPLRQATHTAPEQGARCKVSLGEDGPDVVRRLKVRGVPDYAMLEYPRDHDHGLGLAREVRPSPHWNRRLPCGRPYILWQ